jgi:hypothetical protein
MKLSELLFEDSTKPFYGSNFYYNIKQYIVEDDQGLAMYGVHFSEYEKWGLNPQSGYFPIGVYFYFLAPPVDSALSSGFATDRPWANIAKINNDKMVILKNGHPRNFGEQDYNKALSLLDANKLAKIKDDPKPPLKGFGFTNESNPWFARLATLLYSLDKDTAWNRLLHEVGYSGVVDYDGIFLPIESNQGIQTWPDGAEHVTSIPVPTRNYRQERYQVMLKKLKYQRPGSLKLSLDQVKEIMQMMPTNMDYPKERRMDLFSSLLRTLDLTNKDLWNSDYMQDRVFSFYEDLEQNPTTPIEFWEQLQHLTAKDVLQSKK